MCANNIMIDNDDDDDKKLPTNYPIVFRNEYDIRPDGCLSFLRRLHPFDTCKWGNVAKLIHKSLNGNITFKSPDEPITDQELSLVHSPRFMDSLRSRYCIAMTSEMCILYLMPLSWTNRVLLRPLRYQTSGTLLATNLALKHGSAINIGGGFHHCSGRRSGGFCFFADITLAIMEIWNNDKNQMNILIVDCDAHQGNGYQRDILRMSSKHKKLIYIMDIFNPRIYPDDKYAQSIIDRQVHVGPHTDDKDYLKLLEYHLNAIVEVDRFKPDMIIYNAGTDILRGDPLGRMNISSEAILERDEKMFTFARHKIKACIVMLLSGGYQTTNAAVIANSILNLIRLDLISPLPNNVIVDK